MNRVISKLVLDEIGFILVGHVEIAVRRRRLYAGIEVFGSDSNLTDPPVAQAGGAMLDPIGGRDQRISLGVTCLMPECSDSMNDGMPRSYSIRVATDLPNGAGSVAGLRLDDSFPQLWSWIEIGQS
jgi:hypothetical protein